MQIVISKLPSVLLQHKDHVLQRLVIDWSNYLIDHCVADAECSLEYVKEEVDPTNWNYCRLVLEIRESKHYNAVQLVHLVDCLRGFRQRMNLSTEMHVWPCDYLEFPIEL